MIIQRQDKPRGYTVIPNALLEDSALSYRARGILGYLVSRPHGWETDSLRLARLGKEGRDAVRTALRELDTARYIVRGRGQDETGRWGTLVWVFDAPRTPAERAELLRGLRPLHPGDNPVDSPVEEM